MDTAGASGDDGYSYYFIAGVGSLDRRGSATRVCRILPSVSVTTGGRHLPYFWICLSSYSHASGNDGSRYAYRYCLWT